jgi:hypothetical protein
VWLTAVASDAFLTPWGVYAPSSVTGAITVDPASGTPHADATVSPAVDVANNGSAAAAFTITVSVVDANGSVLATTSGGGTAPPRGVVTWSPSSPLKLAGAALWHLVSPPARPALYTLVTSLAVGGAGAPVDGVNVTFGVRRTAWNASSGFYLNGVPTKILGTANHQDFAAVGVAVPGASRCLLLREWACGCWQDGEQLVGLGRFVPTCLRLQTTSSGTASRSSRRWASTVRPQTARRGERQRGRCGRPTLVVLRPPPPSLTTGWRTAHNPPTPALLDATDELGMLVWDENHRNGQNAEAELLIRRDRECWLAMRWTERRSVAGRPTAQSTMGPGGCCSPLVVERRTAQRRRVRLCTRNCITLVSRCSG